MKSITIKALSVALVMFIMASCSLEKRHYMSGYSVLWKHKKGNSQKLDLSSRQSDKKSAEALTEVVSTVNEVKATVANDNANEFYASAAKGNAEALRKITKPATVNNMSNVNHIRYGVARKAILKAALKSAKKGDDKVTPVVYIILAIFIPFVAVGIATDWGIEVLYNILWMLLCGFPAIIHAFIVLKRLGKI